MPLLIMLAPPMIFFAVSLILFLVSRSMGSRKAVYKVLLIVSASLVGVILVLVGIFSLLMMAVVANM